MRALTPITVSHPRFWRRCCLIAATLMWLPLSAVATDYGQLQTLRATASGEGLPGAQFGSKVAVDGDLAVVYQVSPAHLRGYRRVAGVFQRAPELSIVQASNERVIALALSGEYLIYTTELRPTNSRTVRIVRASAGGWDQAFLFNSATFVNTGDAVAIAGTRAVIGGPDASTNAGAAYVVTRANVGTSWSITATLTPSTPQAGARFGSSVSIVSGAVVVGAPDEDVSNVTLQQSAGAAYVFELTGSIWNQVNRLTGVTPLASQRFGHTVAMSGLDEGTPERLLVGSNEGAGGRVYGYRRGVSNYVSAFTLDPPAQAGQLFGSTISMDGDHAVIGAPSLNFSGSDNGAVFCVDFNPGFTAGVMVRREDPLAEAGATAGASVAIDRNGPTVLAGAPLADLYGNVDQGITLMSIGTAGTPFPPLTRALDLGQGLFNARFGSALSADADAVLVGAPGEAVGNNLGVGAAYVFRRGADGLYALEARWQSPQGGMADFFGDAVAISGDLALVGAPYVDLNGTDAGIVYVYRRTSGVWNIEAQLLGQCSSTARRGFGYKIAFDGTRAMIGGWCPPTIVGGPNNDVGVTLVTRQSNGTWSYGLDTYSSRMFAGGWDNGLAIIGNPITRGPLFGDVEAGFVRSSLFDGSNWVGNGASDNGTNVPTPQGYGYSLSVDQGLLAIASARVNTPVIVRRRSGNNFLPEASLVPTGLTPTDGTQTVAVRGERIAIAASSHTVSVTQQGAVFIFEKRAGSWLQTQRLIASKPQTQSYYGNTMQLAANGALFVSAPEADEQSAFDGVVYVYTELFRDGFE